MERTAQAIGIDVAKATLAVGAWPERRHWQVPNDADGWAQLIATLQAARPTVIVLEASGGYEAGVVLALDAVGLTPVVANPLATRRFAQSLGTRAKTDRIDALLLARYGDQMRPTPRPIASETARRLRALLARRAQITAMLVMEANRRQQAERVVLPSVAGVVAALEQARTEVDALIAATVAADPDWTAQITQLRTVPGIGPVIALVLAVELPELGTGTAKTLASLVGVAPHPRESGRFRGQRHISGGRQGVRRALYQAVHSARLSRDPVIRSHFAQLRARGKTHKQAMVACMRRLLGILHAMVRDHLTWTETTVGQRLFLQEIS